MTRFALGAGLALCAFALPAAASTVSTAWTELPVQNQDECLNIGVNAVAAAGFRGNISSDRQTVFGWRGEEALTIRCISSKGIAVIFAWVTDANNDSGRLVDIVTNAYRNRGAAPAPAPGGGGAPVKRPPQ